MSNIQETPKIITKDELLSYLPIEWKQFIGYQEFEKSYWNTIVDKLNEDKFYPKLRNIFNVFNLINPNEVKVVVIGQDPYINKHQAIGMAFAVHNGLQIPPSLRNIFIEINNEYGLKKDIKKYNKKGDLTSLVKEGVLLLNNILTVKPNKSLSHKNIGWELFTSVVIQKLDTFNDNDIIINNNTDNNTDNSKNTITANITNNIKVNNKCKQDDNDITNDNKNTITANSNIDNNIDNIKQTKHNIVFVGFGNYARDVLIKNVKYNSKLIYGHPSPLNRTNPFIGCNCFKQINEVLKSNNVKEINWFVIFNDDI